MGILGLTNVLEGSSIAYTGMATFASSDFFKFTNTLWTVTNANGLTSRFTITTNGVLTVGNITSNVIVTLNAPYAYQGLGYNATTNVTIINLPPPTFTHFALSSNSGFRFTLNGVPGRTNLIEATTNLNVTNVWSPVATNAGTNGVFTFTDFSRTNLPRRFFRARELP